MRNYTLDVCLFDHGFDRRRITVDIAKFDIIWYRDLEMTVASVSGEILIVSDVAYSAIREDRCVEHDVSWVMANAGCLSIWVDISALLLL